MKLPWRPDGGDKPRKTEERRPDRRRPIQRAGLGLLALAVGRREGFDDFGNTHDAYLASLAPLLAFDLVSNALLAASGSVHAAALIFLVTLCIMLAPAVVSHALTGWWGVREKWPRYANIVNWSWLLIFLLLGLAHATAMIFMAAGAPPGAVENGLRLVIACYLLWFRWFIARGALGISRWRTIGLLVVSDAANGIVLALLVVLTGTPMKIG